MKQLILGMTCCMIAVYTIVCSLSIYSISSHRNEVENCVSQVLDQNLQAYYVRPVETDGEGGDADDGDGEDEVSQPIRLYSDKVVARFVEKDIKDELCSNSQVTVTVYACDMDAGIISVGVTEDFVLPNGAEKEIQCNKTIIVEQ